MNHRRGLLAGIAPDPRVSFVVSPPRPGDRWGAVWVFTYEEPPPFWTRAPDKPPAPPEAKDKP